MGEERQGFRLKLLFDENGYGREKRERRKEGEGERERERGRFKTTALIAGTMETRQTRRVIFESFTFALDETIAERASR